MRESIAAGSGHAGAYRAGSARAAAAADDFRDSTLLASDDRCLLGNHRGPQTTPSQRLADQFSR